MRLPLSPSNPPSCRIGAGGFGTVFKCKLNGKTAVAKQIAPARLAAKDLPLLQNEMCLWAQLDHPNCVKFFGACFEPTELLLSSLRVHAGRLAVGPAQCAALLRPHRRRRRRC